MLGEPWYHHTSVVGPRHRNQIMSSNGLKGNGNEMNRTGQDRTLLKKPLVIETPQTCTAQYKLEVVHDDAEEPCSYKSSCCPLTGPRGEQISTCRILTQPTAKWMHLHLSDTMEHGRYQGARHRSISVFQQAQSLEMRLILLSHAA